MGYPKRLGELNIKIDLIQNLSTIFIGRAAYGISA